MSKMLVAMVLLMTAVGSLSAQARNWDPAGVQMSRPELEDLLKKYEQTVASPVYSAPLKQKARTEAALIRQRLSEGDIRVGDIIDLIVEGEQLLTDTFNVVAGRQIVLPNKIGAIPLAGILRSELQTYLTAKLSQYINKPVVHAMALIRLEIRGAVNGGGYFMVPSDLLVTDALMRAGGPAGDAETNMIEIRRSSEVIWSGRDLRQAMTEGRTLDQLSVHAGDEIFVPRRKEKFGFLRNGLVVLSGITSVLVIARQLGLF